MSRASYDPTDLSGQQRDRQDLEARRRLQREEEVADFKWLMSSPRGRRIMWRLLRMARVFQLSFNTNAMQMAFNEGNRSLGNQLLDEVMSLCPEQFPVMQREHAPATKKEQQDGRDGNGAQSN